MSDKLITIAEFEDSLEAQLAWAELEDNGIKATIVGENVHGLLPTNGMMTVQLQIFESSADKARVILSAAKQDPPIQEDNQ